MVGDEDFDCCTIPQGDAACGKTKCAGEFCRGVGGAGGGLCSHCRACERESDRIRRRDSRIKIGARRAVNAALAANRLKRLPCVAVHHVLWHKKEFRLETGSFLFDGKTGASERVGGI